MQNLMKIIFIDHYVIKGRVVVKMGDAMKMLRVMVCLIFSRGMILGSERSQQESNPKMIRPKDLTINTVVAVSQDLPRQPGAPLEKDKQSWEKVVLNNTNNTKPIKPRKVAKKS